jgi:hypothetical protein
MRRWQIPFFLRVRAKVDRRAVCGQAAIRQLGLHAALFDGRPEVHGTPTRARLRRLHASMQREARAARRLGAAEPLVRTWSLSYDIYCPRLQCFIEIDEYQHFSQPRLRRIQRMKPRYPAHFWDEALPRLLRSPKTDRDPPYRDEARAYRDECREVLPIAYGLRPTIRVDEYSLEASSPGFDEVLEWLLKVATGDGA